MAPDVQSGAILTETVMKTQPKSTRPEASRVPAVWAGTQETWANIVTSRMYERRENALITLTNYCFFRYSWNMRRGNELAARGWLSRARFMLRCMKQEKDANAPN